MTYVSEEMGWCPWDPVNLSKACLVRAGVSLIRLQKGLWPCESNKMRVGLLGPSYPFHKHIANACLM